jgi:hypothetical protein
VRNWRRFRIEDWKWQLDPKHRAAADFAIDLDPAAHDFDQLADDSEPQAGAFDTAVHRAVDLPKRVENAADRVLRDADAGVPDLDAYANLAVAPLQRANVNGNRAALGELDRVAD